LIDVYVKKIDYLLAYHANIYPKEGTMQHIVLNINF